MLHVNNLSFAFGEQTLLAQINLECGPGDVVGIVGKSGSGKTTLLNLISGFLVTAQGRVSVDGQAPRVAARQQKIGYVFQNATLIPWLTVFQNAALPLRLHASKNGRRASGNVVAATLRRAHIADAASKYPHELSGGMQARAAIARALVYQPKLLLLDEPFAGLDDILKESFIYPELQELLATEQVATVLVTHNLNEALLLCDRVHVLRSENGHGPSRLVHLEEVLFDRPRNTALYESQQFMAARRRIREHLL